MDVYRINPITDRRWAALVASHPCASVFHTRGWLEALHRTYAYEPVAYTTSPPGEDLADAIPFCRIRTWLTGRRLVSLPFSDHCAPLVEDSEAVHALFGAVERDMERENWKYAEIRPIASAPPVPSQLSVTEAFAHHTLDLRPGLREVFRRFHKSCVQRKIQRAGREGLTCEIGNSEPVIRKFYSLLLKTRRRHGLPPQPIQWFRNLAACVGDGLQVRVAMKQTVPVAAILTLAHGTTLVYKYGCSDEQFDNLGGIQLLLWKAIEYASASGFVAFDLGRSEADHKGLVAFKDRWGAARSTLHYYRCSLRPALPRTRAWPRNFAKYCFAHIPNPFLAAAGRLLYRHIG